MLYAEPGLDEDLRGMSIKSLQTKVLEAENRLDELPLREIRESGGTIGYATAPRNRDPQSDWVEVDLGALRQIDTIVLVPCVWIDELQKSYDYGFPLEYRIIAFGSDSDSVGTVVYDSKTGQVKPPPMRAPILFEGLSLEAKRIRVVVSQHAIEPVKNRKVFALAEMLIFDGEHNWALGRPVRASSSNEFEPMWGAAFLTDGFMPFSHPRNRTVFKNNFSMMRLESRNEQPSITIDLGEEFDLSEIRLYPIHLSSNYIVFHRMALGFPDRFVIEGSSDSNFSKPTTIFQSIDREYPDPGVRMAVFSASGTTARYVRVTAIQPDRDPKSQGPVMGFAEIEVVSKGKVVSRNQSVTLSHGNASRAYTPDMIVDGRAGRGQIESLRQWLGQLSERRGLELYLASLENELQIHFDRQTTLVRALLGGLAISVIAAIIALLWLNLLKQRRLRRLQDSIAADLHDEIGGNFSGIALLCDQLAGSEQLSKEHAPVIDTIAEVSRQSSEKTRDLVRFLESQDLRGELVSRMKLVAGTLLAQTDYQFDVDGKQHLERLGSERNWHLMLLFKEALTNIVRHANASQVILRLKVTSKRLLLEVIDNGVGLFFNDENDRLPDHLVRRAKKLNGELKFSTPLDGGTKVRFDLNL